MVRDYELAGAEKTLADVHEDNIFSLSDGSKVNSLKELYVALQKMDDSTFSHHVNEARHDFSNWVKDVHRDYKLSNKLDETKDKRSCAHAVGSRIYELQKTIEQRKSMSMKETEMAAERLEKILTEAARANSKILSKPAEEKEEPEVTVMDLVSGESSVVEEPELESPLPGKPRIRNNPFRLKKDEPSLDEENDVAVSELFGSSSVDSVVEVPDPDVKGPSAEDLLEEEPELEEGSPEEMIQFAEEPKFHRKFAEEMSSVFKRSNLTEFKEDMKSIFHSGNEAEHRFLKEKIATAKEEEPAPEVQEPEVTAVPEPEVIEAATVEEKTEIKDNTPAPSSGGDKKEEMLSHLKRVFK